MTPDSDLIEMFLDHLATVRSPRTVRTYGKALWAAHRELPAGVPTAVDYEIAAWLDRYESANTRRTYLSAFRKFAEWAVQYDKISSNEAVKVARASLPESLPDPCEDQELAAILAGAREPYRTWSLIAAYCGARCIEVSRLLREHVTSERTELLGKRDKLRRVPTHELVWAAVRELPTGPVADGRDETYISHRLRAEYLRLGVDVKPHQLRHWYGTTLVANGAGIEEVKELMGHSRLTTTLGYVRVASPRLRAAVSRLPAV